MSHRELSQLVFGTLIKAAIFSTVWQFMRSLPRYDDCLLTVGLIALFLVVTGRWRPSR